jgi:probable rRNA maturation factor
MKVLIFNQTNKELDLYEKTLTHVFSCVQSEDVVSVIFIEDLKMIEMNQTYRKISKTTDVLTFPSDQKVFESIGDIFINIDKVVEQANAYGHSEQREVAFLSVHGYLHILGYDHHNDSDEKEMILAQEDILKRAGLERT